MCVHVRVQEKGGGKVCRKSSRIAITKDRQQTSLYKEEFRKDELQGMEGS